MKLAHPVIKEMFYILSDLSLFTTKNKRNKQ